MNSSSEASRPALKVLLVDDEDDIRKIGRMSLASVGKFQVVMASNAQDGLAAAQAEQPDVILMDMMMPGMDGLTALAALQKDERISAIPVIFMTARVQRHEVEHYLSVGAVGVIQKPFDPMTLPSEVKKILAAQK
jgi:CheY-like chemotaxis protein